MTLDDWFLSLKKTIEDAYLKHEEPWRQSGMSGPEERWISLRKPVADCIDKPGSFLDIDGQRIHYIQAGQGEPVVLIHGWNGSTFTFRYTIPELAHRYRVVALDLLGYG